MSGHTKGPWEYMESSIVGPKLDDKETWLRPVVARFSTGVSFANLNLMLAAPELLEALQSVLDNCLDSEGLCAAHAKARAAIAKAKGGAA